MSTKRIQKKLCNAEKVVYGITTDDHGNIYFTDDRESIYSIHQSNSQEPQVLVQIQGGSLRGIVWNRNNNTLYFCDLADCAIRYYAIDTKESNTLAGGGGRFRRDGKCKVAKFRFPQGITIDKNGDLYVTESHCVRKINMAQQTVSTIAGSEQSGLRNGDSKTAKFFEPSGIALGDDDTIYVADSKNHSIRKVKDGIVSTVVSKLLVPQAVVVDVDGNLLVGENKGLRRVNLQLGMVEDPQDAVQGFIRNVALANNDRSVIICGLRDSLVMLFDPWKWERWIWIGHLKESPEECRLAGVPKEVIQEISKHF